MDITEKTVKEDVAGKLASSVQAFVTSQPQVPDLTTVDVAAIVSVVVSGGAQTEKKVPAFFPADDETAKGILAEIGGSAEIIVVPDSIGMSGENKAITLKSDDRDTYAGLITTAAQKFANVDLNALLERVKAKTILVQQRLMSGGDLEMCGTIWHEYGHVLHEPKETGNVFNHELTMIAKHRKGDLATWIANFRPLRYLARYVSEPGIDEMINTLKTILVPDEFEKFAKLRFDVVNKTKVDEKEPVVTTVTIEVQQLVEGTTEDIWRKAGLVGEIVIDGEMTTGKTVSFGGCTWKVESHYPDEADEPDPAFDTFRLRRLT
jgi:hypothetical protein